MEDKRKKLDPDLLAQVQAFFCKAVEDFQAFVNSYWTKIRQDSLY